MPRFLMQQVGGRMLPHMEKKVEAELKDMSRETGAFKRVIAGIAYMLTHLHAYLLTCLHAYMPTKA